MTETKGPYWGPYFTAPKGLFENGIAQRIGPSAAIIYVALCKYPNCKHSLTFTASDKALSADTGVAARTIRGIRTKLVEEKLISVTRGPGQSYKYTMLHVPYEKTCIKERPREKLKPRALHAPKAPVTARAQPQQVEQPASNSQPIQTELHWSSIA